MNEFGGQVTQLPDGSLQYTEPTNDKPWHDPYPEHPDPAVCQQRASERAESRLQRALKAISEYRKKLQRKEK